MSDHVAISVDDLVEVMKIANAKCICGGSHQHQCNTRGDSIRRYLRDVCGIEITQKGRLRR